MKSIWISNCATERSAISSSCGFTLTEIAIVLGVMGLILGSIWTLADQTWETTRQERLKEEISTVVPNIRNYLIPATDSTLGIAGTFTSLTPQLINANVIPGDMVRRPPNAGGCTNANSFCADHPWGVTVAGLAATGSFGACAWLNGTTTNCTVGSVAYQQFFAIELQGMSQSSCITAALLNAGANAVPGLYDVSINGTSIRSGAGVTHQLPPLASDAEKLCVAPATVDFIYQLTTPQS